ncbi:ABC transporter [Azospirillum cavernae]|uniref:Nickel/cobalt efflux system n=1 Tax=Azospirillum cavernae TaxID=2320860 RepID=A0A418W0S0_9PROT|nr:ABC transporter [Azospirillum cavernae]RJF83622.1 ABC transporter [Azospirillum cavernae]
MRRLSLLAFGLWLALAVPALAASPLAGGRAAAPDEAAASLSLLPEPLRGAAQSLNRLQADLSRRMTGQLQEMRDADGADGGSLVAGAWLCLIAFVYGVLHAAGPGHGKLVVSSYFLANRAAWRRGVLLSVGAALTQALAAILLVGVPVLLLGMTRASALGQIRYLELASYGVMTLIGVGLLVRAARGQVGCGHDHGLSEHGHHQGHDHACGHHHHHAPPAAERRGFRLLAFAVGCRPCSGAVLVLLFALANDMVPAGLLAVLVMAAGVALTTSAAGFVGIGARRGVERLLSARPRAAHVAERGMAFGGAGAVTLLGGLLFLAALGGL